MSSGVSKVSGYIDLIRVPAFSTFWAGRIVSGLGDTLFTMATMWYVLSSTGSALATAVVPLIPTMAFICFAVPLATVADRLPKKFVLIGTDVARGLLVLLIYVLMLLHKVNTVDIYAANLLLSLGDMLFGPAQQAALPSILPDMKRQLILANGLLTATGQSITLFGNGLGGLVVAWLHPETAVLFDGISFFISALTFMLLNILALRSNSSRGIRGFIRDSVEGIRFIWSKRTLRLLICFGAIVNIASAPIQFFTPVFSREVLHAGVTGYGYLEAAAAVGGIIAALISGRVANKLQLWQWTVISFFTAGVALILIAAFPSLVLSVILFGVSMAANALFNIPFASSLQLLAPSEMRGRVMSSFGLFFSASVPIGLIGGGVDH